MSGADHELDFHRALLGRRKSFALMIDIGLLIVTIGLLFALVEAFDPALWLGGAGLLTSVAGWILWKREPASVEARLVERVVAVGRIEPTEQFLSITQRGDCIEVSWQSIVRLLAFKRDLLTTDLICMAIETEDGAYVEINEEMIGWQRTMTHLSEHLPAAIPWADWWPATAFPAFATNPTVVYNRPGGGDSK